MERQQPWCEPYKIKMIEPITVTSKEHRIKAMKEAGYNTFLLQSEDVFIDLLTDSGTSAMSEAQWAGMMLGDEAYAGSKNFRHLVEAVSEVYGYKHVVPTHQGRGAENILSQCLIKKGDMVPGNMYFTTTRQHQELAGGIFVDVIIDQAHDINSDFQWKGNVDIAKMQQLVDEVGEEKIPYLSLETSVNMAGGQPVSMQNMRECWEFCNKYNIFVYLDATRTLENAYFIQQRDPAYKDTSIKDIFKEICSYSHGCTMSSKKDNCVNIGGFLATNIEEHFTKFKEMAVVYEGLHTYGGMSGRDMEALAVGIHEMVATDDHVRARIQQVEYLGNKLIAAGIPVVQPIGGHGVYIDAMTICEHLPQDQFPAQALAAAIYIDSGVRTMERGVVSAGRDHVTGEHHYPKLELVRVTIPRRVYTASHMDYVVESITHVANNAKEVRGLQFIYEPKTLRFFQGRFEQI